VGFVEGAIDLIGGEGDVSEAQVFTGQNYTHPDEFGNYLLPLINGTYDITVSLPTYEFDIEESVNVISGQTVIVNFELVYMNTPENLSATVVDSNDVELNWDMIAIRADSNEKISVNRKTQIPLTELDNNRFDRDIVGFKVYRNDNEIAVKTNHSKEAVDRYIKDYHRVETLWCHGITDLDKISHLSHLSKRVAQQYIDLLPAKLKAYKEQKLKKIDKKHHSENLPISGEKEAGSVGEQPARDNWNRKQVRTSGKSIGSSTD